MSAERIEALHESASELYLNGDYGAALAVWRELLALDPVNEQALEGMRMAQLLVADADGAPTPGGGESDPAETDPYFLDVELDMSPAPTPEPDVNPDEASEAFLLEAEIEEGLSVLNALPSPPKAPAAAGLDPARQDRGIDFGSGGDVASIPRSRSAGVVPASRAAEVRSDAAGSDASDASIDLDLVGDLDPNAPSASDETASVAAGALRRRVLALLEEVRRLRDEGDNDSALRAVSRIYILDETNEEAQALETELRAAESGDLREIENWIVEGVQAFDQGRIDEAQAFFSKVVERSPGHREAEHYLEAIAARRDGEAEIPEELFGGSDMFSGGPAAIPADAPASREPLAIPLDFPVPAAGAGQLARERPPRPSPPELSGSVVPRRSLSLPKWAIVAGLGGAVIALAVLFLPGMLTDGEQTEDQGAGVAPVPRPAPGAKGPRAAAASEPARGTTAATAASAEQAIGRARAAMVRGDYGGAVLAFHDAIAIDSANAEALAGIEEAGDLYKAQKAEREQLDRVKLAFRDGEYASALRVLYRLPASYDKSIVDRWKVDGWFNLGVVALRAGEAPQSVRHFDEALAILPDADAAKWKTFAQRYRNRARDRAYYSAVESIPFRTLD